MGMQDRDGWRDAQRKRDGAPGGGPSEPKKVLTPAQTTRRATLAIMVFWLVVMAVLYVVFDQLEQRKKIARTPQMNAAGELVIERGRDGHFRLPGTVNGRPVQFLVDTGASLVSVSEAFAREAGLSGGQSATFHTANGTRPGRIISDVPVSAGGALVPAVRVGVGLTGMGQDQALLGQSFLSRFDIQLNGPQMIMRPRSP